MVSGTKSWEAYSFGKKHTVIALKQNIGILQSLVHKLSHSLNRSDREQARTAGAVLVITIPNLEIFLSYVVLEIFMWYETYVICKWFNVWRQEVYTFLENQEISKRTWHHYFDVMTLCFTKCRKVSSDFVE